MRHPCGPAYLLRLQLGPLREPFHLWPAGSLRAERCSTRARRTSDLAGPGNTLVLPSGHRLGGSAGHDLQAMGKRIDFERGRRVPGRALDLDILGGGMVMGAAATVAGNAGADGARGAPRTTA